MLILIKTKELQPILFQDEHPKGDDEDSDADLCLDENVPYGDRSNGYPGISTVNGIVSFSLIFKLYFL